MLFKLTVRVDDKLTKTGDKRFALVWEGEKGEQVVWEGFRFTKDHKILPPSFFINNGSGRFAPYQPCSINPKLQEGLMHEFLMAEISQEEGLRPTGDLIHG